MLDHVTVGYKRYFAAAVLLDYETHAAHDGPWLDPDRALGAMFDAALQGFPAPPAGKRRVDILLPR